MRSDLERAFTHTVGPPRAFAKIGHIGLLPLKSLIEPVAATLTDLMQNGTVATPHVLLAERMSGAVGSGSRGGIQRRWY